LCTYCAPGVIFPFCDLSFCPKHSQVKISIVFDPSESRAPLQFAGVLAFAVCELMDNFLAALAGVGQITANFSSLSSAQLLRIVVKDSGPGVANEVRHSMFNAGVSTKGQGRGLGLCLVKEAISALKGEIQYDFEKGAVFTITVPFTGAGHGA